MCILVGRSILNYYIMTVDIVMQEIVAIDASWILNGLGAELVDF